MRYIIPALVLLFASVAHAGTIAVTVTTATGACSGSCTKTYTDSDANFGKVVAAYQSDCNVKVNGTCTTGQVVQFWFDQLIAKTVADVQSNLTAAQQKALVPPTPINPQ